MTDTDNDAYPHDEGSEAARIATTENPYLRHAPILKYGSRGPAQTLNVDVELEILYSLCRYCGRRIAYTYSADPSTPHPHPRVWIDVLLETRICGGGQSYEVGHEHGVFAGYAKRKTDDRK